MSLAPVEGRARAGHRPGQRDPLVERHAAEEDSHGEGGRLSLGDRAACEARDEVADLARAQSLAVALGADDFLGEDHGLGLRYDLDKAAQQALEVLGGLSRDRLRLRVARIAAGETRGVVGDDRDRGAAQARAARQDDLGDGRHADEIGAQDSRGANLGRRLEARSRKPHIDALVHFDARASGRFV